MRVKWSTQHPRPTIDLNSCPSASDVAAGWVWQSANGINDKAWIVRSAFNTFTYRNHAFELSVNAVPEPQNHALALSGLIVVGYLKRRAQKA